MRTDPATSNNATSNRTPFPPACYTEQVKKFLISLLSQDRIAGGAAVLALTQLIASACGFFRDRAFSTMFPLDRDPLGVASAYIAAFRPSDLLFQLFVMSTLSVILVPFLAHHLAHDRREEMNRLIGSILVLFGCGFGVLALLMAVLFPWLAPHLTHFTGPTLEIYVRYGQIAFLTNFLFVFGNTIGQYLIAVQRYWIYGLTPIVWAVSTILGIYLLSPRIGPMGPIVGTLIGTILYVLIRSAGAVRAGFEIKRPETGFIHSEIREIGWLIIPRMAALGALQLQLLLIDKIGSGLGKQVVALNQFASNFESVIPGIVGIAIAQSSFSLLSQAVAKGKFDMFSTYLKKGMLMNLSLALPGAIALALCSSIAVWLLKLDASVAPLFVRSLLIYCFAVPFESTNHILLRSFYSLKNTTVPAICSTLSAACAIAAAYTLAPSMGLFALAVAYVVGQVTQTMLLGLTLFMRLRDKRSLLNASHA